MRPSFTSIHIADIAQDIRAAMRRMRCTPVLTIAIVLTIGLGLGVAAAIFTVSHAALLEPLPYAEPDALAHLWEMRTGTVERSATSYPTLLDWRSRARSFSALEGYDPSNVIVGVDDEARMVRGAQVTAGFFRLLGVRMSAGRDFQAEDAAAGAGVAIVSESFARSFVGAMALDQTVSINGVRHVIVGVLPTAFHFALLENADIFVPLVLDDERRADRFNRSIEVIGRLRGNVPLESARAELSAVAYDLASEHPDALAGRTVVARPLRDALLGNMKPILASLLVAVGLLVVIIGTNLTLLMVTRYVERAPELTMRTALGATRARILWQLFVESLMPSLVGAALAAAIGQLSARSLLAAVPDGVKIGMPYLLIAGLDGTVIGVIVGVAIVLAIGFGIGPALVIKNVSARPDAARATLASGDRRLRRGLVAAQMALTVVLLVSAGLLVMSFGNLMYRDVGFRDPSGLVVARLPLSGPRYQSPVAQQQFYEALLARSQALPGIRDASLIEEVPGGGSRVTTFEPVDRPRPRSMQPLAALRIVGGDYFETMGIPIVAGRAFDARDRSDTQPVAVVSASLASMLGEDGATVRRRLRLAATGATEWEVVGIVGDVQVAALDAESPPAVYLSHLQRAENRMTLVLRTEIDVATVANQIRAIVKTLDAGVPVYAVTTLHQRLSESRAIFSRRMPMILCGVFAAAALALTLVALYAICLHEVLTRRREFGIRLAVGATRGAIRRLALSDSLRVGAVGVGVGVFVAALVSSSMDALLFGVAATDWRVYGIVAASVLASALLATLGPALRAGSVDPSAVTRGE